MTETPTSNTPATEGEFIPAPVTLTIEQAGGSRDNAYIFNYTNNPKARKTAALRACYPEGEEPNHIRQEAHRIHGRLRLKIQAVITEMNRDLSSMANYQLNNILNMDVTETGFANMLGAIKMANDISDAKPAPVSDLPQKPKAADLTNRIESLRKQIEQAEGNKALPSPA